MYRSPLLVLPYSERPLSNLYRKKLLYVKFFFSKLDERELRNVLELEVRII